MELKGPFLNLSGNNIASLLIYKAMRIFLIFFFLLGAAHAKGNSTGLGHYVGNSGDGYLVNDRVVLRDLYEQGSSEKPYVGPTSDLRFQNSFQKSNVQGLLSDTESQIFLRKLTDLNQLYPQMGDFVLETLKNYDLALIPWELGLLPDKTPILNPPGDRVQVANRLSTSIRISHPQWARMDAHSRVALLIHEALYALTMPRCKAQLSFPFPDHICEQSSEKAKEITGAIFRSPASWPHLNTANVEAAFAIQVYPTCKAAEEIAVITSTGAKLTTGLPAHAKERDKIIQDACQSIARDRLSMQMSLTRKSFKSRFDEFYVVEGDQVWRQKRLMLMPQSPTWSFSVSGGPSCVELLQRRLIRFFDETGFIPQEKSQCEIQSTFEYVYVHVGH